MLTKEATVANFSDGVQTTDFPHNITEKNYNNGIVQKLCILLSITTLLNYNAVNYLDLADNLEATPTSM